MINQYKKILIDYTNICSVTITPQDAQAITILEKMDVENLGKITIVMAVNENEHHVMEKVTKVYLLIARPIYLLLTLEATL